MKILCSFYIVFAVFEELTKEHHGAMIEKEMQLS